MWRPLRRRFPPTFRTFLSTSPCTRKPARWGSETQHREGRSSEAQDYHAESPLPDARLGLMPQSRPNTSKLRKRPVSGTLSRSSPHSSITQSHTIEACDLACRFPNVVLQRAPIPPQPNTQAEASPPTNRCRLRLVKPYARTSKAFSKQALQPIFTQIEAVRVANPPPRGSPQKSERE